MLRVLLTPLLCCVLLMGCQFPLNEKLIVEQLPSGTPAVPNLPPPTPPSDYDPDKPSDTYIDGIVVNITPEQFVITTSLASLYTVHLAPPSKLKRSSEDIGAPMQIGDHVEVLGQVNHEIKTAEAEEVWINFVRVSGKLSDIQHIANGVQFKVLDVRQGTFVAVLDQNTRVTLEGAEGEVLVDEVPWENVEFADVSGFKRTDGSVEAITVFLTCN